MSARLDEIMTIINNSTPANTVVQAALLNGLINVVLGKFQREDIGFGYKEGLKDFDTSKY